MRNKIEQILAELYQSDPALKQHEEILKKLIVELMASKPDTQFDERFKQELRRKLMSLAETEESKSPLISNFMKRFQFVGAGVAIIALLAVSVWYLNGLNGSSPSSLTSMLSGAKITKAGDNAFGSLTNVQTASGRGGGGSTSTTNESLSLAPSSDPSVPMGMGGDTKMIAPEQPINFRYIYKGEALTLANSQMEVLKRNKFENNNNLSDFINKISLGLINLNSFNNSQLQSFTFSEDRDLGYMVNVNLSEGSININENWVKWQKTIMPCALDSVGGDAITCQPKKIDISQIPADEVLINTATAFLEEHGIPKENYGTPSVNNEWRVQYERAEDKSTYWVPDVINVVFPLILNGQEVYDESGNPNGLNVSIRFTPEVKVSGVWELTTQNYESSSYEAETDVSRIMKLAETGGFRNYYYSDPKGKNVDLDLGTPEVSYVKLWNYRDGNNEELLVPALIFPVTSEPTTDIGPYYWYRKNVVIPLVKEILDNENNNDPIRIMPAGGGASEPGVMKAQ